ncbi:MAG: LLM class flavin-dependent oxidoreductase [Actinomycetota bacterium]|nr:LLM class flavin-dependent oxidoreductase [Actinomycetota bacterium]
MKLEVGLQIHLPTYASTPLSDLLGLARAAAGAEFDQIWVTDNLGSRSPFVVLAALAGTVPTKLGAAVMNQYLRSPVEAARALLVLGELMEGRELTVGLGSGNPFTDRLISRRRPITFLRETLTALAALLAGEELAIGGLPLLMEYFGFAAEARVELPAPATRDQIHLYGGGNGPKSLSVAGELADGVLVGWTLLPLVRLGRLATVLQTADGSARAVGRSRPRRVGEIKISVDRDHRRAREFVRTKAESAAQRSLSLRRRGYDDADLRLLGIDPVDVDSIERAVRAGHDHGDLSAFVSDGMIDACFIAGDPTYCRERLTEVAEVATRNGVHQLMFSELGPDPPESLRLIADQIWPDLLDRAR